MMKLIDDIIVIDLEMTCCDNGSMQKEESEIIEIGAVKIDPIEFRSISQFQSFVCPSKNARLTPFCENLTGISQFDVYASQEFFQIWPIFLSWCDGIRAFCSWGCGDLTQIMRECLINKQPLTFTGHCDLTKVLGKSKRLLLKRHNIKTNSDYHRALGDAIKEALILQRVKPDIKFKEIKI